MVASLVVIGVVVIGLLTARGSGSPGGAAATSSVPPGPALTVVNASELVAIGHSADNPTELRNLYDGDSSTTWSTSIYTSPAFGNLYDGLGVILQLSGRHVLHQMTVTSSTQDWSAQAYAAGSEPAGNAVAAWGRPTAAISHIRGTATFDLGGHEGAWVMLWLTNLGPSDQVTIADVTIS